MQLIKSQVLVSDSAHACCVCVHVCVCMARESVYCSFVTLPAEHVTCSAGSNAAMAPTKETVYNHVKDAAKNTYRDGVYLECGSEASSARQHLLM